MTPRGTEVLEICDADVLGGMHCLQVRADTNFVELLDANPWLKSTKLVVKPDMLFGKRGKHDLVGLNLDFAGVEAFIKARMGKVSGRTAQRTLYQYVKLVGVIITTSSRMTISLRF